MEIKLSIHELLSQWQQSIENDQPAFIKDDHQPEEYYQVTGLHTRTSLYAGSKTFLNLQGPDWGVCFK